DKVSMLRLDSFTDARISLAEFHGTERIPQRLLGGRMAAKKTTGIIPTMIQYGDGISAVRALPKAKGKRPAVIILHERYGIDQHTKDLTVKLAQAGFVGLAPDLFHRFTGDRKAVLRGEQRVDL